MPGEPLVDERVVRRKEIEGAAVLLDDVVEEEFRLGEHGVAELLVVIREQQAVGIYLLQVLEPQPLGRET